VCAPAIAAFLIVAAPWYTAVSLDQGRRFLDVFILDHNVQRLTSTIHHHPGPLWYYLPVLLAGLFPWSGLLVPGLFRISPRTSRRDLLVLLWLAAPLLFFSLAGSKLPGYILPCVPPLAILMGRAADRLVNEAPTPERLLSSRLTGLVGLVLGALLATLPGWLLRIQEPLWRSAIPLGFWAVLMTFLVWRRIGPDPAGALRLLRTGAAGLLLLFALAAPPILARRESGRAFFKAAMGREVLAWGAWRTAWMAGYFYNEARVREVTAASEILASAEQGPVLVLAGPSERRRLEAMGSLEVHVLVQGVRDNALLRLERAQAR
jgi:4-amino-4-deoxy-L-arabinose transferase-like glycosyltransferase